MLRPVLIALAALAIAAGGCGEKEEPELRGPPTPMIEPPERVADERGMPAGDGRGGIRLREIGEFDRPLYVAQPPREGRELYVVEQPGRVVRIDARGRTSTFLDISGRVSCCGEQGLLSLAFAPDYAATGRFYVNYTDRRGDTRVVEYETQRVRRGSGPRARRVVRVRAGSARELLHARQPFPNHNGGLVTFGPDRMLYIGMGDGGSAGDPDRVAQDLGPLLGKILRIDPRRRGASPYRIPPDNPFVDRAGARPEIVAYGLRNPWRFTFDRVGGALWIGDVGQSSQEEIDVVENPLAGANFGWSAYEGTERFNSDQRAPNALRPVLTYGRDRGCSVTGGHVVRDRRLESLYGRYVYGDFCEGQLRSFTAAEAIPGPARDDRPLDVQVRSLSSFAEDTRGRIYATSLEGPVYRLVPSGR